MKGLRVLQSQGLCAWEDGAFVLNPMAIERLEQGRLSPEATLAVIAWMAKAALPQEFGAGGFWGSSGPREPMPPGWRLACGFGRVPPQGMVMEPADSVRMNPCEPASAVRSNPDYSRR
jgi:hypothetical protein